MGRDTGQYGKLESGLAYYTIFEFSSESETLGRSKAMSEWNDFEIIHTADR